jgi:hypothetical protein
MRWLLMQSNTGGVAQKDDAVSGLRACASRGGLFNFGKW